MTIRPIRVLHVSPSFYPAISYGGPIYSTKMITDGIAKIQGFEVRVLSTDTADPNSRARLQLATNPLVLPAGYPVRYCRVRAGSSISSELLWRLWREIHEADVVHLTGPYNFPVVPTLLICRWKKKPLVWSPRGGFQATSEWKNSPNRWAKTQFERLCGILRPRSTYLHVTAEVEAETSSRHLGAVETVLIPNALEFIPETPIARNWRPGGRLRLAFLSRVHEKKGLELLLAVMAKLPEHITLDIYGDGDPAYVAALHSQVDTYKISNRVHFHGHVSGDAKITALTSCDVFILPTHSENFGIVIAEALAHGTPVITTWNAPWSGLETEGCGCWVEATVEALVGAVNRMESADLNKIGALGHGWMAREFSAQSMVDKFCVLYRRLASS